MNDDQIVELYLKRSEDAIAETKTKYGAGLREIAYRILNDRETAEECEYDAYYKTWSMIPPHEPRTYLFAFIGKIIRHLALDICRKNHRQKRYTLYCELTQEMEECIPAQDDTEAAAEAGILGGLIDSFLAKCPADRRNIFVRRYWFFDPITQIAEKYGYSESKVKTMLLRMRADLKKHLENGGYRI